MRHPRNALVIYNPRSGPFTDKALWLGAIVEKLCTSGKYFVTVKATDRALDIEKIFDSVHGSPDLVVAAGGDGTIRAVLGAVATSYPLVPVGVVPFGTGNQLARNLGVYEDNILVDPLETVVDVLVKGDRRKIDIGRVNGNFFCVGVGAGPLADAVAAPTQEDKESWGMLAYIGSMLQTLKAVPVEFVVTADGDTFTIKAAGVFVTNVGNYGLTTISDTASLDDGMLDLCIVTLSEISDYVKLGFQFASAILGSGAPYYLRKVKHVRIESRAGSLPVNVDGDHCGTTPMEVEVLPNAVTVLCRPADS